jgi:hypothetical protein
MENSKSNSQEYNQMTNLSEGNRAEIKKALSRAAFSEGSGYRSTIDQKFRCGQKSEMVNIMK